MSWRVILVGHVENLSEGPMSWSIRSKRLLSLRENRSDFAEPLIFAASKSLLLYYFITTRRQQHPQIYETVAESSVFYFTCVVRDCV